MECGGRGSAGAQGVVAGRALPVSEPLARGRTALFAFAKASADSHLSPAKPLGEDGCCVRQNRVVLASVADVKLRGGEVGSTGLDQPSIRQRR